TSGEVSDVPSLGNEMSAAQGHRDPVPQAADRDPDRADTHVSDGDDQDAPDDDALTDDERHGVEESFVLSDPEAFEAARVERFKQRQEQFRLGHWDQVRKRDLILLYPVRLGIQTFREMRRDKLFVRASSLAYFTTLSLIPLLVVSMSLLLGFGAEQGARLMEMLQQVLLPAAGDKVT